MILPEKAGKQNYNVNQRTKYSEMKFQELRNQYLNRIIIHSEKGKIFKY